MEGKSAHFPCLRKGRGVDKDRKGGGDAGGGSFKAGMGDRIAENIWHLVKKKASRKRRKNKTTEGVKEKEKRNDCKDRGGKGVIFAKRLQIKKKNMYVEAKKKKKQP